MVLTDRSTGATWYGETPKYFGGAVKTISKVMGGRSGSLVLCPPKMLDVLPLEGNRVFIVKNLTLIA
jgi:hypothetical protein